MRAAPAAGPDPGNVRIGSIDAVLATRHAGTRKLRLAYELVGPAGAPVVFVAGGISAHRHVAANGGDPSQGWAEGLVATGRALDPSSQRILAFDYVGACGGIDAPIDTADQADAVALLLDALGIDALEAFVGYSYGALVGLQLAARHPRASCASWSRSAARIARIRMPPRGARCSARPSRWASCNARTSRGCRWRASSRC